RSLGRGHGQEARRGGRRAGGALPGRNESRGRDRGGHAEEHVRQDQPVRLVGDRAAGGRGPEVPVPALSRERGAMRTDEEATQRMTTATDVQAQAREVYRQSVAAEMPLTGRQLGEMFDRSERWGRDRIAEVKRETAERLPLELPFSGSAAGESAAEPVSAGRQNGSGDGSRAAVERQPERQAAEPVTAGRQNGSRAAAEEVPRWVLVTAWVAVGVVAAVAATVSFEHMRELAARSGEGWRSWLLPLSADGLIVAGSLVLYVRSRSGEQAGFLPWLALRGGLAVSVAAHVGTALLAPPGELVPVPVRMAVAGFAPVALVVAAELLMQLVRQSRRKERGRR